jgi:carbon monoxide dehydrogenase subunit G
VATFVVRLDVDAPAAGAWARITDWAAHGRWVPLTRVVVTRGTGGTGTRFVGRTGIGPLGFDDPMEVIACRPPAGDEPGVCTVVKRGRVVLGWAEVRVEPLGRSRCRVTWTEDVEVAPVALTRWAAPLVQLLGRVAFARVLRAMAREVVAEQGVARG